MKTKYKYSVSVYRKILKMCHYEDFMRVEWRWIRLRKDKFSNKRDAIKYANSWAEWYGFKVALRMERKTNVK